MCPLGAVRVPDVRDPEMYGCFTQEDGRDKNDHLNHCKGQNRRQGLVGALIDKVAVPSIQMMMGI